MYVTLHLTHISFFRDNGIKYRNYVLVKRELLEVCFSPCKEKIKPKTHLWLFEQKSFAILKRQIDLVTVLEAISSRWYSKP